MITLTIIVFGHTHLYKYNLELNCDSLVSHHTWFFLFYALFSGKKLRKDSKTYQDLPSLLEMSILFTLADVAAVAKTWSTTGIHFLLLKPRKAKGSGDTPWYYGCTVYVCKSVLHCVFKVLSVSLSHEVELLICVGCFDNVLLYMLTKSWRNIFFSHFAIQQSGKRQNHVFCYVLR